MMMNDDDKITGLHLAGPAVFEALQNEGLKEDELFLGGLLILSRRALSRNNLYGDLNPLRGLGTLTFL